MTPDLPLPDLSFSTARRSTADDATWLVRVSAFRDPVADASELARILRIDLERAQHIARNAPGVLVAGTTRSRAEQVAAAVRTLGVKARVEDALDDRPLSSFPPGPPSVAPPPVEPPAQEGARSGPGRGFWVQVPMAFVAPFMGQGSLLLLASGFTGLGIFFMLAVPFFLVAKIIAAAALSFVAVGVIYETFDRLAQSATLREPDEWVGSPISRLPSFGALCARGFVMSLASGALTLGAMASMPLLGDRVSVLFLVLASLFYWPMAMTVMSVRGSVFALVDFVSVFRGISVAPLEYLTVCVAMFAAFAGTTVVVLTATGVSAGAGLGLFGGGLASAGIAAFVLVFFYYAGLAYLHGVMGYLMGSLVRSKQERFEFMLS